MPDMENFQEIAQMQQTTIEDVLSPYPPLDETKEALQFLENVEATVKDGTVHIYQAHEDTCDLKQILGQLADLIMGAYGTQEKTTPNQQSLQPEGASQNQRNNYKTSIS